MYYFTEYIKCIPVEKVQWELDGVLYNVAKTTPTRKSMILLGCKTYSELLNKIVKVIAENIFKRVLSGKLVVNKSPKKDQNVLFQIIGSLNLMHPMEIVKYKMLGNFLSGDHGVDTMEKLLYVDKSEIDGVLNELSDNDILMSFIYFNIACLRLAGKAIRVEKEAYNPNLLKLFLRHYTEFASVNKINTDSDDEDYVIPHKTRTYSEELSPNQPTFKPPQRTQVKPNHGTLAGAHKKVDIFVTDSASSTGLKASDLKNKYEFPSLTDNTAPAKPANVKANQWGNGDAYLYEKKGAFTKKELEEQFPSLGSDDKKPAPKPVVKKEEPKPKPVVTNEPKLVSAPAPTGGFDWLELSKQQAKESAKLNEVVTITKAKKKKK